MNKSVAVHPAKDGLNLRRLSRNALKPRIDDNLGERMEPLRLNTAPLDTMDEYVEEVGRLWADAQHRFIAIGRHLLNAKQTLAHGEWEVMITSKLPFNRSVAHSLRAVAEAVEAGRIAEDELPNSYTTAYKLTTLSDADLGQARSKGVVRPDVSRKEVDIFRKTLRSLYKEPEARTDLLREKTRLEREIAAAQRRISEIDVQLRPVATEAPMLRRPSGVVIEGAPIREDAPARSRRG